MTQGTSLQQPGLGAETQHLCAKSRVPDARAPVRQQWEGAAAELRAGVS